MEILNFGKSKIKQDLLSLYFSRPEKKYYLRELERMLGRPVAYIRRELMRMEEEGLFHSEFVGKERFFSLNKEYYLYEDIKKIVEKTIGIEGSLRKQLKNVKGVKEAYIFGSYAKNRLSPESDIDILVIGDNSNDELTTVISGLERKYNREFNVVDMDESEFKKRKKKKDELLLNIFSDKNIKLITSRRWTSEKDYL